MPYITHITLTTVYITPQVALIYHHSNDLSLYRSYGGAIYASGNTSYLSVSTSVSTYVLGSTGLSHSTVLTSALNVVNCSFHGGIAAFGAGRGVVDG